MLLNFTLQMWIKYIFFDTHFAAVLSFLFFTFSCRRYQSTAAQFGKEQYREQNNRIHNYIKIN